MFGDDGMYMGDGSLESVEDKLNVHEPIGTFLSEKRFKIITDHRFREAMRHYGEYPVYKDDVLSFPGTQQHVLDNPHLYNIVVKGIQCYIRRNFSGSWCAYMQIPNGVKYVEPSWNIDVEDEEDDGYNDANE